MAQRHFCFAATLFLIMGDMYGRFTADERFLLSRLPMLAFTGDTGVSGRCVCACLGVPASGSGSKRYWECSKSR